MKKIKLAILAVAALVALGSTFTSCASSDVNTGDPAITKGIEAWNKKGASTAKDYWDKIVDEKTKQKYLNYITLYEKGVTALDSTDSIKASQESKLLSAVNTALNNFSKLDPALDLTQEVCDKGASVTAPRIDKLLEQEKIADAKKLLKTAKSVYGSYPELDTVGKEVDTVNSIVTKRTALKESVEKAKEIEDVDNKISTFQSLADSVPSKQKEVSDIASKSGVGSTNAVKVSVKSFNNVCQDVLAERKLAIREKAYEYKERIGDVFSRETPTTGSGKGGAVTNQDILNHYTSVKKDMNVVYSELLEFQKKYPEEIDANVIKDINNQKSTLESKIAVVEKEIAKEKEIASRGKYIGMIGLFNSESGDAKKSKPAKFSGNTAKTEDYLWGIADIPAGEMNDLVITLKDNRTIHVYNQNTKSGKQIEKLKLQDLISRQNKVGNSWPVMNAREALNGSIFYIQIEQGKAAEYSGEAVIYSSFITRSR